MLKRVKLLPFATLLLFLFTIGTLPLSAWQNIVPPAPRRRVQPASVKINPPKLVVYIVIDQFRAEFLNRFSNWFGPGGFRALIKDGAYFTNANYRHGATYTGPGHAVIASGAYGAQHGIVANKWFNRATGKSEAMIYDGAHPFIGVSEVSSEDETSPANFIGTTIGDQLLLSNGFQSKVIAIAVKDRAAINLGGRLGKAYWFNESKGEFLTSTYYMKELPKWLQDFNARRLADNYFGKSWERLPDEGLYKSCHIDDYQFEMDPKGNGRAFPHKVTGKLEKPGADYYEAFEHTPWANDLTFELARMAIEAEALGTDNIPDLLAISLTANDLVGHAYGPYSQEVADITVRTDRQLGDFLAYLEKRVGASDLLVVLTADHGAGAVPEYMAQLQLAGGRIKKKKIKETIEVALNARYGNANWVVAMEDPSIYLNYQAIDERKLSHTEVERAAGDALLTIPGVAGYLTRTQFLAGSLPNTAIAAAYQRSFHPDRSGDVILILKPFYIWGKYAEKDEGATHGSPYSYDTHVPLIIRNSAISPGIYPADTDIADLAPTIATILKINPPAACQGRPLVDALR
ncbi:MAG: alkaline phosphatase family protein [Acidobacteriota bacterium]